MFSQPNKLKRQLPRFTLRFLLASLTLGCISLAGWKPIQRHAYEDIREYEFNTFESSMNACSSPFPLIVANDGIGSSGDPFGDWTLRRYYLWFFGYVVKLPYERELN